ncbi:MAG: hypothetical protein BGO55_14735 [Sphingobacteriales bacterium 50-39]|nr:lipocalin family protein [Sphingobacteriales bacterium]OJW57535.1 MAG: hypothetical protein BGO55_14735 [Sphingobacteriales bacterium 50-39]
MMKSLPSVGLLLFTLLSGCSKSHSPQPGLIGQWRLDNAVSVTPGTVIDYAAGAVLELRSDSTYAQMISGRVGVSGTYSTADSSIGTVSHSFLYLKATGDTTIYRYEMQLNDLKLTLTGKYAIEYFRKL